MDTRTGGKTPARKREDTIRKILLLLISILSMLVLIFLFLPGPEQGGGSPEESPGSASQNYPSDPGFPASEGAVGSLGEVRVSPAEDPGTGASAGSGDSGEDQSRPDQEQNASLRPGGRPALVIVIDDVGYNLSGLELFLEVPVPLSFAVLPALDYSYESAKRVLDAGQELIMHLPMESLGGENPGPGTLREQMSIQELGEVLASNAASVPGIQGINNHMGSRGTSDERIVRQVLGFVRDRGLFFLDSRTTDKTVVPRVAQDMGMTILERDIFLDNSKAREDILAALQQGKEIARRDGQAILIGHVWTEELAQVLLENYEFILEEGFDFTSLSSLILKGD